MENECIVSSMQKLNKLFDVYVSIKSPRSLEIELSLGIGERSCFHTTVRVAGRSETSVSDSDSTQLQTELYFE